MHNLVSDSHRQVYAEYSFPISTSYPGSKEGHIGRAVTQCETGKTAPLSTFQGSGKRLLKAGRANYVFRSQQLGRKEIVIPETYAASLVEMMSRSWSACYWPLHSSSSSKPTYAKTSSTGSGTLLLSASRHVPEDWVTFPSLYLV